MNDEQSPLLPDDERARDRLRGALALACALAVVLAGTLVPAVPGAGLGGTPLGSVVPTPNVGPSGLSGGGGGPSGPSGGGLGALNPGDRTGVGGSLAENGSAFRSRNAETHFTVRSTAPSYWRTGAYDTYTGSGWERSGDRRPYAGPIEGEGIRDREVAYRVTLRRSATALPSVWRANSVSKTGADALYVTDQRGFVTGDPVPAGTTYRGVSHLPPRDPTVLRTAGRDYPVDVERRYTALPEDTDRRLREFTHRLTSDADSPYESAKRIESWLEANKNYSLNVSDPAGDDVASQFVFDMEEGYCEYFATAMTVMLRSQGVPARYVVGYSTGQSVGANTYRVRAMNAHAWVEVYFPDVGWVRFDPTPGQERLQSERQALRNRTDADAGEYDHTETGSPGEAFSPNGSAGATTADGSATGTAGGIDGTATGETPTARPPTADGTTGGTTPADADSSPGGTGQPDGTATGAGGTHRTGESAPDAGESGTTTGGTGGPGETTTPSDGRSPAGSSYRVELNRTPVPGATVEVAVVDDATPAGGVPVYFNGERVGVTDRGGVVTARVPYARNLTITVGDERRAAAVSTPPAIDAPAAVTGSPAFAVPPALGAPPATDAPMALTAGPPRAASSPDTPLAQSAGNRTDNGSDERRAGTEYSLATDAALAVSGDAETGETVVVTATVRGVPVRNAEVRLDGDPVGTTDGNGRAEVRLPDAPGNVTVSVARGPVSGETTVTVPRLAVEVAPRLPLALPGTPVEVRATYGGDPLANASVEVGDATRTTGVDGSATAALPFRGSAAVVVSAEGQTRRTTVSGLFVNLAGLLGGAAVVLGGLGVAAARRGFGPRRLVALAVAGLRALPDLAVAALFGAADRLAWAIGTVLDALRDLRAGETTVGELLARLRAWLRERGLAARVSASETVANLSGTSAGSGVTADEREDSYRTLREAWDTFLGVVSVRRPAALTPGELADHAVREDDLPPGPVLTLRDAFRNVEYGASSPGDRLPQVEEAVAAIERAAREDGEDEPASPDVGEADEPAPPDAGGDG